MAKSGSMATSGKRVAGLGTDWASLFAGIGLGVTIALEVVTMTKADFRDVYQIIDTVARFCALIGTYFALFGVLLVARVPWVEKGVGHDRLVTWHRKLGPYSLYLITLHVFLVIIGYAGQEHIMIAKEIWRIISTYPEMWLALIGFVLMIQAGITSYKRARAKMSYESWWIIHVLTYVAIAAAFQHQIFNGPMFINHPLNRLYWIALYFFVAMSIIIWRIGIPIYKSFRHNLKVDRVVVEGPGVVSVIMRGRNLNKLSAEGGQFFGWRFLQRGHFLMSHPYSLSAAPQNNGMRITVKNLGDHSADLIHLKPGTRVFVEGPYGAFTANRATRKHVLLVGGGVGITPIRAIIEEFRDGVQMDVLYRASSEEDLVLKKELDFLAANSNGSLRVHYLVGSRQKHPMNSKQIQRYAPYFADSDVYVCGPEGMVKAVRKAAAQVGVPKNRFHDEAFAFHSN